MRATPALEPFPEDFNRAQQSLARCLWTAQACRQREGHTVLWRRTKGATCVPVGITPRTPPSHAVMVGVPFSQAANGGRGGRRDVRARHGSSLRQGCNEGAQTPRGGLGRKGPVENPGGATSEGRKLCTLAALQHCIRAVRLAVRDGQLAVLGASQVHWCALRLRDPGLWEPKALVVGPTG